MPVPHPPVTGQVHDQIFIDGMHLSGGWVLLIARDREHVLEWQWAANESAQAYTALLERGVFNCLCIRLLFERIDA